MLKATVGQPLNPARMKFGKLIRRTAGGCTLLVSLVCVVVWIRSYFCADDIKVCHRTFIDAGGRPLDVTSESQLALLKFASSHGGRIEQRMLRLGIGNGRLLVSHAYERSA